MLSKIQVTKGANKTVESLEELVMYTVPSQIRYFILFC